MILYRINSNFPCAYSSCVGMYTHTHCGEQDPSANSNNNNKNNHTFIFTKKYMKNRQILT